MFHKTKITSAIFLMSGLLSTNILAQSLEESVEKTLSSEPKIAEAFHLYKAYQQDIDIAKSGYLPQVNLQAGYGYESSDNPSTRLANDAPRELTRGELSVSLKQKIFDGFAVMDNVKRTKFEATASQYALYGLAENQALKVASVYLGVLEANKILSLSKKNLKAHEKVYDQINDRVTQGLGSKADLSQIEGRLARAQVNVISSEHNLLDAKSKFVDIVD